MSLYNHQGGPVALLPGRPMVAFRIDSIDPKTNELDARGIITVRDPTQQAVSLRDMQYVWRAVALVVREELGEWVITNGSRNYFSIDASLHGAIRAYIRDRVQDLVLQHPERYLQLKKDESKSPTANGSVFHSVPPPSDTDFPVNWAAHAKFAPAPARKPNKSSLRLSEVESSLMGPPTARVNSPSVCAVSLASRHSNRSPKPRIIVEDAIPVYRGPIEEYTGPCVCDELYESNPRAKFNWQEKTRGRFADRCFECSCGTQWWSSRPSDGYWNRVADSLAWVTLTRRNGIPTKSIVYVGVEVYHIDTLRGTGNPLPYYVHHES